MAYIRKSQFFILLIGLVRAEFEGSGEEPEETQIKETPVYVYEPFNCWRCDAQSSFAECIANGRKEYCPHGQEGCFVHVEKKYHVNSPPPKLRERVTMGCKQPRSCGAFKKELMKNFKTCQPTGPFSRFLSESECIQCCLDSGCTDNEKMSFNKGQVSATWSQVSQFNRNFWVF